MLFEEIDEELRNQEEAVAEGMRKSKIGTFSQFGGIIVLNIVMFTSLGSMSSDIEAKSQGVAVEDRNDIPEKYKRGDDKVTSSEGSYCQVVLKPTISQSPMFTFTEHQAVFDFPQKVTLMLYFL